MGFQCRVIAALALFGGSASSSCASAELGEPATSLLCLLLGPQEDSESWLVLAANPRLRRVRCLVARERRVEVFLETALHWDAESEMGQGLLSADADCLAKLVDVDVDAPLGEHVEVGGRVFKLEVADLGHAGVARRVPAEEVDRLVALAAEDEVGERVVEIGEEGANSVVEETFLEGRRDVADVVGLPRALVHVVEAEGHNAVFVNPLHALVASAHISLY